MKIKRVIAFITFSLILVACRAESTDLTQEFPPENFSFAAGEISFPVSVNGVVVQVTDVQIFPGDEHITDGYVYVVPTISVTNRSEELVRSDQFSMLDQYLNEYQSWQTDVSFADSLQAMPEFVDSGQTTTGQQVFIVPSSTLGASMRVRWQSLPHESQIDISVGDLPRQ